MCSQPSTSVSAVASGRPQYSTKCAGVWMQTWPISPLGSGRPASSTIFTWLPGQTWPAEPSRGLPSTWSAGFRQVTTLPVSAAAYIWARSQPKPSMHILSWAGEIGEPP